jgi:hypothetical protein
MLAFALVLSLVSLASTPVVANSKDKAQLQHAEKVRAGITKLGVGREAQVRIKLKSKAELAGFISDSGADSFMITEPLTGESRNVAYAEVTQLKGHNLQRRRR